MSRTAREKCDNSIYHICIRGNNKQDIFLDHSDRQEYLKRVRRYKERYKVKIYAYCLMTNHLHLLIYDNNQDISKFMQGLNLSYAIYFNHKYNRCGHLFQERFTSVMVNSDSYFLNVSKYIHLNPVSAGLVAEAKNYEWSSYCVYLGKRDKYRIIDCEAILQYFATGRMKAIGLYQNYVEEEQVDGAGDEIATTQEAESLVGSVRRGIPKLDIEQIFNLLKKQWGKDVNKILHSYKEEKSMRQLEGVYFVSLLGRFTYQQTADLIGYSINDVRQKIWTMVDLMIKNQQLCHQVDEWVDNIFLGCI